MAGIWAVLADRLAPWPEPRGAWLLIASLDFLIGVVVLATPFHLRRIRRSHARTMRGVLYVATFAVSAHFLCVPLTLLWLTWELRLTADVSLLAVYGVLNGFIWLARHERP